MQNEQVATAQAEPLTIDIRRLEKVECTITRFEDMY
jgi:hypothetical protein